MAASSFHDAVIRAAGGPKKAAKQLAYREKRLAELDAGATPRALERVDELRRLTDRLASALRETVHCRDCGVRLTDPASIARGIGPDCWAKREAPHAGMSELLFLDDDEAF